MNETAAVINKYNIRAKKGLSQNFLADEFVINKIADSARLDENTSVIEIGGGAGSLTKELLRRAGSVQVIELDSFLCEVLEKEYGENGKLTVTNADVMKTDLNAIIARELKNGRDVKVCANLPYHLTSPIIIRLLTETSGLTGLTLMMQKEVADRVLSSPGRKTYGSLTVLINYYAETSLAANVPPNCFIPRPSVHSAVVSFDILKRKRFLPKDERLMFEVIRAAFGQRRKTLYNALSNQLTGITREKLLECLTSLEYAGITPQIRGEKLGLPEFALLADAISEEMCGNRRLGTR